MPVYSKTLSREWRKAFEEYEAISGFEPMYQEDIDSGIKTAQQAWSDNVQWIEDVVASVIHIKTPWETDVETTVTPAKAGAQLEKEQQG